MILLKIEKIIITGTRIIIVIEGLWVILHVQWCWIVVKTVDESTGSQVALDSPSSLHSRRPTELSMIVVSFAKSGVSCAVKLW
jgi:hypothetical protein